MNRPLITALCLLVMSDDADARRRYTIVRAKPRHHLVQQEPQAETKQVRIIPIVRWRLWCERIGGNECP